jgi:hypothetical protein
MIRKQYMAPALTAVEMKEGAMLCTSGGLGDGENLETTPGDGEDGEGMDQTSLPSASSVWNEW